MILKSALVLGLFAVAAAQAETISFDQETVGSAPSACTPGATGWGWPKWTIESDPSGPSKPNVLKQSGIATYPWCVKKDVSLADGYVETMFKALSGWFDQAGGVVWRWKDRDNYYVARANARENNVSLYYTVGGDRKTILYVDAPVPPNTWHRLRVEFMGKRIKVMLNGKTYIELEDDHISGAGAVGVWTKADSATAFDDLAYGPISATGRVEAPAR